MRATSRYNYFNQIGWAIVLTLIISLAFVRRASAHAYLIRSDPPANSILGAAPTAMNLWFSEVITPAFSSAQLLTNNGQSLDVSVAMDATDPTLLIVHLPELTEGVYSLRWTVHSAADGHFTRGLIIFGIGEGADLGTATAVATKTAVPFPELILRWLTFGLYAGLIGAFAATYLVLDPNSQPAAIATVQRMAQKRMLHWAWWCSLLAIVVGIAWAGWQAITLADSLSGSISIAADGWQWLTQTRLGFYWWARQGVLLITAVYLRLLSRQQTGTVISSWIIPLTSILLLMLLLIQSLTSHAAALTHNTALAVAADTLHLLAASFWVGGLLALVIGLLPLVRHHTDFTPLVKAGWQPFSRWAALSVGILLVTGIYSTGREVSSPNAMITTLYGQTLLFKIGLMLLVGLIGATNAIILHPNLAAALAHLLRKPEGWTPFSIRQLPRLFLTEVGLGLLVLFLTGVITAAPTARGAAYTAAVNAQSTFNQTVDDMFITLAANPNRAGQNIFTVRAVSTRRPPPAEIVRVILRFTYLDEDLGLASVDMDTFEPDLYLLSGNQLYLAGNWQIDVVVRRQGIEDSVAQFKWIVPQANPQQPAIISDQPWESLLTMVTALLLLVMGTVVLWYFIRQ